MPQIKSASQEPLSWHVVVGTINALITQYDAIFSGTFTATNILQVSLTYMVPFGVSAFSSAMQARHDDLEAGMI